ncbi:MAG: hypothetical protein AB7V16_12950 [Vulcanibacillus sp.]
MEEVYFVLVVIGAFLLNLERFLNVLEKAKKLFQNKKDSSPPTK